MYSFYCEDLNETINVTTSISQPFNDYSSSFNPIEPVAPIDFLGRYYNDLVAAHNNHLNWASNVIKLGYVFQEDATDFLMLLKAEYNHTTNKIKIWGGEIYNTAANPPANPIDWDTHSSYEITFTDYSNDPKLGYLYIIYHKLRDLFSTPPAYTGAGKIFIGYNKARLYSGVMKPATTEYPYGWWEYTYRRLAYIDEFPLCTPCQITAESVQDCEVIVAMLQGSLSYVTSLTPYNITDADGNYNPDPDEPVPEEPFDPSIPDPYIPEKDDTSDEIDIPTTPPIGVTNAGFINVYNPGMGALQGLGDILFPNVASATDVLDALLKICETLANQNLINYVIDCHVIPVKPTVGASQSIKVGFNNTSIMVPVVTSDYIDVSCGSLNIHEYFGGFQDYTLTKSKLYLPFVGFVDTLPEYWVAGTIKVDYRFNVIDGSFMAFVRSTSGRSQLSNTVIAQYAGNACMHFPITGVNYAQMTSGLIGAATSMAGAKSNPTAALGAAHSAANTVAQWGEVQQSNGYNSTAALLGVRVPYLLIERPVPSYSQNYKHDRGYPTNIATTLSNVSGYTEIEDIDLSGIPLTQAEIEELRGLLKEGVYF